MEKLQANQILVKGAKLLAVKLKETDAVTKLINETQQRQIAVLKLKKIDQERLKVVIQF